MRDTYLRGLPSEVAARIPAESWGRHEPFFELVEVLSWMQDLPRMEAHVFDAGHMLLETHAAEAASLMVDFIKRTQRTGRNWRA
jgi:surfactin synthase thioesterase subunit